MKNNALVILVILLLVSAAGNYIQWKNAKEEQNHHLADNSRLNDLLDAKQAQVDTAVGRIQALRVQVAARKAKDSVAIAGLKRANSRLSLKTQQLRPLIAPHLAENDTLNAFALLQDSLLAGKDSIIYSQELFCQLQVRDLSKIIELQEQKFEAQKQITAAVTEQLADETRGHRKTKRKGKFKNVVIGVLGAAALYLSVKP